MGYMDITIEGSDMAEGAWHIVKEAAREDGLDEAIRKLRAELDAPVYSPYNTPGPINAALVLVEAKPDYDDPSFVLKDVLPGASGYQELVQDTLNKLTELRAEWADASWDGAAVRRQDGSDNKQYHLDVVDRLLEGLRQLAH